MWTILLVIYIAISSTTSSAIEQERKTCAATVTSPSILKEDHLILEQGQSLRLQCILDESEKYASDLIFYRNGERMDSNYTQILNESTLELFLKEPISTTDVYICKLKLRDNITEETEREVCSINVLIGSKPRKPENFRCNFYNWLGVTCSWDPQHNPIKTTFTLYQEFDSYRRGHSRYKCDDQRNDRNEQMTSCTFDSSTNSIYRMHYPKYKFILRVENELGNWIEQYTFDHFASIVPAKAEEFGPKENTTESVYLYWKLFYTMTFFPPGLNYRLTYKSQRDSGENWKMINITGKELPKKNHYNLTGLECHTAYDLRLYIRSSSAVGEDKWSDFSNITVTTASKKPGLPPTTDVGSFEVHKYPQGYMDVTIYWKPIPFHLKCGENFQYRIINVETESRRVDLEPTKINRIYAKFEKIAIGSYQFEIVSTNLEGRSENSSKIFVPHNLELIPKPYSVKKTLLRDDEYEVSWQYDEYFREDISDFTLFWCQDERDRPFPCEGNLDWIHVPKYTSVYQIKVPDKRNYQFAISANSEISNSGMAWNTRICLKRENRDECAEYY